MLNVDLHDPISAEASHFVSDGKKHASVTFKCARGDNIQLFTSPDAADALVAAWNSLARCNTCGELVESVDEADDCPDCVEKRIAREYAKYRPLYEAEKAAGLLRPQSEIDDDLRQAGRGHLIR